jgi:tellurite resistance protein TerC
VIFGLVVVWLWGGTYAGEYYAGFVTEWALSVDNLFVFTIIMSSFAVPRENQQKVLLIGILMALVMRAIFTRWARPPSTPSAGCSTSSGCC